MGLMEIEKKSYYKTLINFIQKESEVLYYTHLSTEFL